MRYSRHHVRERTDEHARRFQNWTVLHTLPSLVDASLERIEWQNALSRAAAVPAVIDVVQRILDARRAHLSCWQPRKISSREDIEHWERRIRLRSVGRPSEPSLVAVGELMRFALDRMNALGPKRGP